MSVYFLSRRICERWGLPSSLGGSASSIGLATNVWVLILIADVEAKVVDDVAGVLKHIGALLEVASSSIAALVLELGHVVGVAGGRKARENAFAGKEEGAPGDGQDSSLSAGITLLELGKVVDETERLGIGLEDRLRVAAEDDENVKVLEAVVGLLEGNLRTDNGTLLRENLGFISDNGDFKGFAGCGASAGLARATNATTNAVGDKVLTIVVEVVGGRGKDLHGTSEVEEVKLGVQGDEHVNGLIGHCRSLVHTHFDGIVCGGCELRG